MSGMEPYFVDIIGFGIPVDIMPRVHEAMEECPYKHDLTALEVAQLTEKACSGEYISVDVLDRIEGRMLGSLTGKVIKRVHTAYRILQVSDPYLRMLRPFIELDYFKDTGICSFAKDMTDRWLEPGELQEFPLRNCRHDDCTCSYRTRSRREGKRIHPCWPVSDIRTDKE